MGYGYGLGGKWQLANRNGPIDDAIRRHSTPQSRMPARPLATSIDVPHSASNLLQCPPHLVLCNM